MQTLTLQLYTKRSLWQQALMGLLGSAIGIGAAVALAWFMYSLVHRSEMQLADTHRTQMLDFVRVQRSEAVERKDRKPQRPQTTQAPNAPPAPQEAASASGQVLAVSALAPVQADLGVVDAGAGFGAGEGDYLPIVKVAPIYPRSALVRKLEGHCTVTYTVTTAGTVKDIEVLEAYCTDPIFHHPSIEAAKRFKYKPRIVDGIAVEVRGVNNVFYYEIQQDQQRGQS